MVQFFNRLFYVCAVLLFVLPLVSCGGGGAGTVASSSGSGTVGTTGTLSIGLTDAPAGYEALYVTIEDVKVIQPALDDTVEANWVTVLTLNQTFNLLDLVGGVIRDLGVAELEAGHYNQMRLKLGVQHDGTQNKFGDQHEFANYLILQGETDQIELKVPSGQQTGIKLVKGFDIVASGSTELVLDFDALKSVVQAGKSGKWLLKPTIKVIESVTYSVEGTVDAGEGAVVSAQVYNSSAADPKEEVVGTAGTVSGADGYYFMYLPIIQDSFNIVATMTGYLPECQVLDSVGVMGYTRNFTLSPATTGTFAASATGLETADSALFSIRQEVGPCGMVEVASASVVNSTTEPATYFESVSLPVGIYEVVVSADGEVTQVWNMEVVAGTETILDTYFPTTTAEGTVSEGAVLLADAVISAQYAAINVAETASDLDGEYFMYLPTGESSYNVVVTRDNYVPQCQVATVGLINTLNFDLVAPAEIGTISGSVIGLTTAGPVLFSIQQDIGSCGKVELKTFSLADGESFGPVDFPVGTYQVVVTAEGETTQISDFDLLVGVNEPVDADFTP